MKKWHNIIFLSFIVIIFVKLGIEKFGQNKNNNIDSNSSVPEATAASVCQNCVPLTIRETSNLTRTKEPITSGVPLPEAVIFSTSNLRVLNASQQEVPAQFKVLSRWGALSDASKSIKWVLVDFQSDLQAGAQATYYLEYGPQVAHQNYGNDLLIFDNEHYKFSSGKISFDIPKTSFSLFNQVFANGINITESSEENGIFALEHETNKLYSSRLGAPLSVDIEENGPMKAVLQMQGPFMTTEGEYLGKKSDVARLVQEYPYVHYNIRVTVYKDKDYAKLQFILENDGAIGVGSETRPGFPKQHIFLEDLRLKTFLNFDSPSIYTVNSQYTGNSAILATRGQFANVSDTFPYTLKIDGAVAESGTKYPGWFEVSNGQKNIALGMKYFWQKHPVDLSYENGAIELGVMPEGEGFPLGVNDYYDFEGGRHYGVELLYRFSSGIRDAGETKKSMAFLNDPLFAFAPPAYYASTHVWDKLAPPYVQVEDPVLQEAINRYEKQVLAQADINYAEKTSRYAANTVSSFRGDSAQWFGSLNFGDILWSKSYSSLHYDWTQGMLLHMLRHTNTTFWKQAQEFIPHRRDVDQYWGDKKDSINGDLLVTNMSRYEAECHNQPSMADSYGCPPTPKPSHDWNGGLVLSYLLTGDEEAREAAEEHYKFANIWFKDKLQTQKFSFCELRMQGWTIVGLLNLYRATGEQKYIDLALAIGKNDLLYGEQQAGGNGVWEGPDNTNQASVCSREEMSNTQYKYIADALTDLYEETKDNEIGQLIVRMTDYNMKKNVYGGIYNAQGFYKPLQTDAYYKGTGIRDNVSETSRSYFFTDLAAVAYQVTGDKKYLDFASNLFKDVSFYYMGEGKEYIDPARRDPAAFADDVYTQTWSKLRGYLLRSHQIYLNIESQGAANDNIAPAVTSDLAAKYINETSVVLTWTSPGDDGNQGRAKEYEMRYQEGTMTEANWANAIRPEDTPIPNPAGTKENMSVVLLKPDTTYSFAFKTNDKAEHVSGLSNILVVKTKPTHTIAPENGLVGYWAFENNANDISGNNHHGTIAGSPAWKIGKLGNALEFDGATEVTVSDTINMNNTNKLSISFWVYPTLLDNKMRLLVYQQAYGVFFYSGNKIFVDIVGDGNRFSTNKVFQPNQWYHVAVVYDGALPDMERVKIYVNGELDKTGKEASTSIPTYSMPLYFGKAVYTTRFIGKLDEVAIRQRALTAQEIANEIALTVPVAEPVKENNSDITAPVISQINASNITSSGATVTWQTKEAASSKVEYGLTSSYGSSTNLDNNLVTTHSVNLAGLENNKTYHYRVISNDQAGNSSQSQDGTFVTTEVDKTPPIGSIKVKDGVTLTNNRTINLEIFASDPAGMVEMKISEKNNFSEAIAEAFNSSRTWTFSSQDGLKTIYVWFKDKLGNWSTDPYNAAITLDTTPADIKKMEIKNITENGAQISWQTSEESRSQVEYGLTSSYGEKTTLSAFGLGDLITLTKLSEDTTYHYRVDAQDKAGNKSQSIDYIFTTAKGNKGEDKTAPARINDLRVQNISQTSLELLWTAPGDDDNEGMASAYEVRYLEGNLTEGNWKNAIDVSGEPVPSKAKTAESIYITVGLSPGKNYSFGIKTKDEANNWSPLSNVIQVVTQSLSSGGNSGSGGSGSFGGNGGGSSGGLYNDVIPPAQPSQFKATPAEKQILLTWDNPKDDDFVRIKILRKEGSAPSSIDDKGAFVVYECNKEEYTDTNLNNDKIYYYSIFTYDKKPNYSKALTILGQPKAGQSTVYKPIELPANDAGHGNKYNGVKNLYGLAPEAAESISQDEAQKIFGHNQFVTLNNIGKELYLKIMALNKKTLLGNAKYSIAMFINEGTETTKILGDGERAGVISSYQQAFNKLPQTESEWQDVIKIANGRWPKEKNASKEKETQEKIFLKIYKRVPNMANANDNAAVTIITYGLRPVARNMESEKAGIRIFKGVYGYNPTSAFDWDVVRAIAYSGAKK